MRKADAQLERDRAKKEAAVAARLKAQLEDDDGGYVAQGRGAAREEDGQRSLEVGDETTCLPNALDTSLVAFGIELERHATLSIMPADGSYPNADAAINFVRGLELGVDLKLRPDLSNNELKLVCVKGGVFVVKLLVWVGKKCDKHFISFDANTGVLRDNYKFAKKITLTEADKANMTEARKVFKNDDGWFPRADKVMVSNVYELVRVGL